jgi:hypothetical protein
MADDRAQARREAAVLLGVDIERLSPADGLRVDMISALRLVIDSEQASILSGGSADLGKLNVAVQSLIALLPSQKLPETSPVDGGSNDPRTIMWETYKTMRDRGALHGEGLDGLKLTVEKLQAELAAKDTRIAELEVSLAGSVPLPPNAVKLRNDNPSPRTPSSTSSPAPAEQPPRPLRIGEAWSRDRGFYPIPPRPSAAPASAAPPEPAAPQPAAAAPAYDYSARSEWKDFINEDGSIRTAPLGGGKYWGPV